MSPLAHVLTVLVVATGLLAGCGGRGHDATGSISKSVLKLVSSAGPFPKVSGDFGVQPRITDPRAKPSPQLQRKILKVGKGASVQTGDLIAVDFLGQVWGAGTFENTYAAKQADAVQIGIGQLAVKAWDTALVGLTVGTRVELTVPPAFGYGAKGNPSAKIRATDTLVFVIDIGRRYNGHSTADPSGALVSAPTGAPKVSGDLTTSPTIVIPARAVPPAKKQTYVLSRGKGPVVRNGQVAVQYHAVDWTGAEVGSTWTYGTASAVPVGGAQNATGGLFDSLAGIPIGSRVMIVAPGTPGADLLSTSSVVVVDVLDQITTAKQMAGASS